MPQREPILKLAQNEGSIYEIGSYRRGRKCKVCKKRLSMYNPSVYCHAHAFRGALQDLEKREARRWENIKKRMDKVKEEYRKKKGKKR